MLINPRHSKRTVNGAQATLCISSRFRPRPSSWLAPRPPRGIGACRRHPRGCRRLSHRVRNRRHHLLDRTCLWRLAMAKLAFVPPLADAILAEFPARAELPLPLPLVLVVRAHRLARVAQRLVGRCRAEWRLTVNVHASITKGEANGGRG